MSESITSTAQHLGDLCMLKNAAYGDSVGRAAEMLTLLYPRGLKPAQYYDALIDARIFEKQLRAATQGDSPDPHDEDPREDRAGYALLALHRSRNQSKETPSCPGSARRPDALDSSKAHPDSAASQKNESTTTSVDESRNKTSSPSPDASSASTSELEQISRISAHIQAATDRAAARREGALAVARERNKTARCGSCNCPVDGGQAYRVFKFNTGEALPGGPVVFHSGQCADDYLRLLIKVL